MADRTPAGNNGTHKNLLRLVICPIYSVVKVRPRQLALADPPERVWVFSQPNVRRQATFSNRDTESVVALTPNIGLELLGSSVYSLPRPDQSPRSNKTQQCKDAEDRKRDHRRRPQSIGMRRKYANRSPSDCCEGNTKYTEQQSDQNAQYTLQICLLSLVELTGIEPVASWLQTRRSPS
jgi:hypothetical protein